MDLFGLTSRYWQGSMPTLEGKIYAFALLQLLETMCSFWLMALFSMFKVSKSKSSPFRAAISLVLLHGHIFLFHF